MLSDRMMPANRFSTRPLYLQLRDALAERIASGEWKPGTVIPNEGDLAREFGVSSGTMRKALDLMEGEHLLTRRQGRGTFVNDQASDELAVRFSNIRGPSGERIAGQAKLLDIVETEASEIECDRLRLEPEDMVYRIRRIRSCGDRPFMWEETSMPAAMFPGLGEKRNFSHRIAVLAQQYGILLGKAEERISIATSTPAVSEALRLQHATPIMMLDRVVYALDGRPVEWRIGYCDFAGKYYLAEIH